jgi:hypothetical protein
VGSLAKTNPRIQIVLWNQLFDVEAATEMPATGSKFGLPWFWQSDPGKGNSNWFNGLGVDYGEMIRPVMSAA